MTSATEGKGSSEKQFKQPNELEQQARQAGPNGGPPDLCSWGSN